jgi:hypothetical protein
MNQNSKWWFSAIVEDAVETADVAAVAPELALTASASAI